MREVFGGSPVAALTLPGDRRDDLLAQSAEAVAAWFGTVVLYEDSDRRGRAPGEMLALVEGALRAARPGIRCAPAESPAEALRTAIGLAGDGPVLFVYEELGAALDALAAAGAEPWGDDDGAAGAGADAAGAGTAGGAPGEAAGAGPGTASAGAGQASASAPDPEDPECGDAARAAIASATAVVAGAAEVAETAVAEAAAVVAGAEASATAQSRDASADYG